MHDQNLDGDAAPVKAKRKKSDLFFAVDVRMVESAAMGSLNTGVALVVMAAGTGHDHSTTSWSANAVEVYTSISRGRAKASVEALIKRELVEQVEKGKRPRYRVRPWASIVGKILSGVPEDERRVFWVVVAGEGVSAEDQGALAALEQRGFVKDGIPTFWLDPAPKLAWLPMSFVCGVEGEDTPPLERLRRLQDPKAFKLAFDFYFEQQMAEHDGIPRNILFRIHDREKLIETGPLNVWGFSPNAQGFAYPDKRPIAEQIGAAPANETQEQRNERCKGIWEIIALLMHSGILIWVPQLFEGSSLEAGPVHPVNWGDGDGIEDQLGRASRAAALAVIERSNMPWIDHGKIESLRLAVAKNSIPNLQLIDVARMQYRPHTRPNSAWARKYEQGSRDMLAGYLQIIDETTGRKVSKTKRTA